MDKEITHEYINKILQELEADPIILTDCVINLKKGRSVIYLLSGDTDYQQKELEICYADKHSDIIYKGIVKTREELHKIVLENLKK